MEKQQEQDEEFQKQAEGDVQKLIEGRKRRIIVILQRTNNDN